VFIAATTLVLGSVLHRFGPVGPMSAALAGAALGFLIYNFNPAKIFMGDCGSMFMGFTLAGLTILSANTAAGASSLALSLLIPVGALVVPIFDTALVTFQRTSHGRSIAQGGRDHSSHRLVFLGLSEKKAVLLLLGISLLGALVSLALARLASPLTAAVLAALVVVTLVFFGIYLGDVKVYDSKTRAGSRYQNTVLGGIIMHKKQILKIVVDTVLLAAAYTAAWLLRFEGDLSAQGEMLLAQSLPWLLAAKLVSFWAFGLYRGDWRYVSVHDIVQILKGCLTGSLVTLLMIVILYRFQWYSRAVLIIDFFLAFMFIAGARSLIRIFREKVNVQKGVPVLIVGAGDGGELLLRELRNNPALSYTAVGFIDDDPTKRGQVIHGVKVLGSRKDLAELIAGHEVRRVFISILSAPEKGFKDVFRTCRDLGVDCTRVQPMIKIQ
jgi:UDP-GlcNAc:undecaprenyl-phosphate GlcNAc-1-phosphate transferase